MEQFIIPKESYGRWATIIDGIRPKRNADNVIMTVQQTQSTLAGVQSKTTKPTMQTTKKNDSEMRKEDEQEAVGENKSKTEEDIDQEELYQVIQGLVASGMPIKAIEELTFSGKTEAKKRLKLGRGRGRDRGMGSGKGRNMGRGT